MENNHSLAKGLKIGFLEIILGSLMVIGIIGYFLGVNADLDWIDHTISFLLFTYLFYHLDLTKFIFGKRDHLANILITFSFFALFFKDILGYTLDLKGKFEVLAFLEPITGFIGANLGQLTLASFYVGIIGIILSCFLLLRDPKIHHPSLLYALVSDLKNKALFFFASLLILLGFYYFIYAPILEWLEFVLDDPIIVVGILFFVVRIVRRKENLHPDSFVFRIGQFSESLYLKFISLFHYKKTLPLALSGLMILHALADLGVFAYTLSFSQENFYLERIEGEHTSFPSLFLSDSANQTIPLLLSFGALYALNALSLFFLLAMPIIAWWALFIGKGLHLRRWWLFFIWASLCAFALSSAYSILPLGEGSLAGVDISARSIVENPSWVITLFSLPIEANIALALLSLGVGFFALLLSKNPRAKKELFVIPLLLSLLFFGFYLYFYMGSLLLYFSHAVLITYISGHILISATLLLFAILSIIFYVGGYFTLLYELAMEYHRRKWSDPIDEQIISLVRKVERWGVSHLKGKKAQKSPKSSKKKPGRTK